MLSACDPWADILPQKYSAGRIERRADPHHPIDFFRARLPSGEYLFILKNISNFEMASIPVLSGINILVEQEKDETKELILMLVNQEQFSLFRTLTHDLLNITSDLPAGSSNFAALRICKRIERWQALLRRSRDGLSRQGIIGLVGELLFIKNKLLPYLSIDQTIRAWRGPHRDEQDFALANAIIEVKSQESTADQYLRINSESQLDESSGRIVICHQTLAPCQKNDSQGLSLNELVNSIHEMSMSHSLIVSDLFYAGLLAYGYQFKPEYDNEIWKPVRLRTFEVIDDFPRIVARHLPGGISNVTYCITLSACERFERTSNWLESVIHGRD